MLSHDNHVNRDSDPGTMNSSSNRYSVMNIITRKGERVPVLKNEQTRMPELLSMHWVIELRRDKASTTLRQKTGVLRVLYEWAYQETNCDLGILLLENNDQALEFFKNHIHSLVNALWRNNRSGGDVLPGVYNTKLEVVKSFVLWAIEFTRYVLTPTEEKPEHDRTHQDQLEIEKLFEKKLSRWHVSTPHEPLEPLDIKKIIDAIGPREKENGDIYYRFFSPATAHCYWLMYLFGTNFGLRVGELLKLRLENLPARNQKNPTITIKRYPDDPDDSRILEPQVKTSDRTLNFPIELLEPLYLYLEGPAPMGRPKSSSPYLFLTYQGNPIASRTAHQIIKKIGRVSGVEDLKWHRLRHTWANHYREFLDSKGAPIDYFMYLGGWDSEEVANHYSKKTLQKRANNLLREWQIETSTLWMRKNKDLSDEH